MFALNVLTVLGVLLTLSVADAAETDWSYKGKTGPRFWASLEPQSFYSQCAPSNNPLQSPINIDTGSVVQGGSSTLSDITQYPSSAVFEPVEVTNNFNFRCFPPGSCGSLTLDEDVFSLVQMHLHTRSEHKIDGRASRFEVHLVHANSEGDLAVLGVLADPVPGRGKGNYRINLAAAIRAISNGQEFSLALNDIISGDSGYYRYLGNLTTPPCAAGSGVKWVVQQEIASIRRPQIQRFKRKSEFSARGNWRNIQPLSGQVTEYSA